MSQICSRIHIKVTSPAVWQKCKNLFDSNSKYNEDYYFGFDLTDIANTEGVDFIISTDWSCPEMGPLVNALTNAIGDDGIIIADWTDLNTNPFEYYFYSINSYVKRGEFNIYYNNERAEMFFNTNIEDIVSWLNYGKFKLNNFEIQHLEQHGIRSFFDKVEYEKDVASGEYASGRVLISVNDESVWQTLASADFSDVTFALPESAKKLFSNIDGTDFILDSAWHILPGGTVTSPLYRFVKKVYTTAGKDNCIVLADCAITKNHKFYECVYQLGEGMKHVSKTRAISSVMINDPKEWLKQVNAPLKDSHYANMAKLPSALYDFAREHCEYNGIPIRGAICAPAKALKGLKLCVTGSLDAFPESGAHPTRKNFQKFIENYGGTLVGSVSSVTDYLICNDRSSGTKKLSDAEQFNVAIITEKEFFDLLKTKTEQIEKNKSSAQNPNIEASWSYEMKAGGTIKLIDYIGWDTDITVPETINGTIVDEIGAYAFSTGTGAHASKDIRKRREKIESVQISNHIIHIGDYAFSECKNLKTIIIPDSVTEIGEFAFADCKKLESIIIGSAVDTIGVGILRGCKALKSITISKDNPVLFGNNCIINQRENALYTVCASSVFSEADGIRIIKEYAFSSYKNLKTIILPNGLTEVSGFKDCALLKEISIPDTVTVIGNNAFNGCRALTSVHLPDSVTSIGERAFEGSSLQEIYLPDSVTSIGEHAFMGSSLQKIHIPNGITRIENSTFRSCGLREIHLPDSVTSIGERAFMGSSSLQEIYLPDSVTSIGMQAFCLCASLQKIHIPNGITNIRKSTFKYCEALQELHLSNSLMTIEENAFYNCTSLEELHLPNNLMAIEENAFYNCTSLEELHLPGSITSIGEHAFAQCESLQKVHLSDGIRTMGHCVFRDCGNLTAVNLPDSITSMGNNIFNDCPLVTIFGHNGSFGHNYAREYGLNFCEI